MFTKGETVGSLRAYFLIAGTIVVLDDVLRLVMAPANLIALVQTFAALVAGVICLYLAIDLRRLMKVQPLFAQQIVIIMGAFIAGAGIFSLIVLEMGGVIRGAIGVLIVWYIVGNLKRLSAEQTVVTVPEGETSAPLESA